MASDEVKPSSLDYGVIIAFVAPGFVAFHAASYHLPTAASWMNAAPEKDQSVGLFLFVLLASLSAGLIVSGVRALLIDNLLFHAPSWFAVQSYTIDWSKVDEKKLAILLTIRDGHYRYYQFYSNTFVALVFWLSCRISSDAPCLKTWHWVLALAILFSLLLSARDSLNRYGRAIGQALK